MYNINVFSKPQSNTTRVGGIYKLNDITMLHITMYSVAERKWPQTKTFVSVKPTYKQKTRI